MADDADFQVNLLRMIAASVYFQSALLASRELFGKSYFALGPAEKAAVDQAVLGSVGANFQAVTPELLADQQAKQPMGFVTPTTAPTPGSSKP